MEKDRSIPDILKEVSRVCTCERHGYEMPEPVTVTVTVTVPSGIFDAGV